LISQDVLLRLTGVYLEPILRSTNDKFFYLKVSTIHTF